MKVASVGAVVRSYRKASGISQKDLAQMVGMSRATLNYLESGRDIEIGAAKLLALLDVLAVPFAIPTEIDRAGDQATVDRATKTVSGKGKRLTHKVMAEAMATGRVPIGYEKSVAGFVEQASEPEILALVRLSSATADLSVSAVWKNARSLAKAVGSTRKGWIRGD